MAEPPRGQDWHNRLNGQGIIVATANATPIGFMSLKPSQAYIDLAFILYSARGRGVFRKLYEHIEALAVRENCPRISVDASIAARPAFEAVGFALISSENIERGSETLKRFKMEKRLVG